MANIRAAVLRAVTHALAASGDQLAKLYRVRDDPWPIYRRIRDRGPIYRSLLGYSAVSSHELCAKVLRGTEFGIRDAQGRLTDEQALPFGMEPSLLELDPPDHGRLRRLVAPAFRPKLINGYRPQIEKAANSLLDKVTGSFDLITDFATPLPITVISELLGIPEDRRGEFARYGTLTGQALDGRLTGRESRELEAAVVALNDMFTELVAKRRADPGDDVISVLVRAVDAEQVTPGELLATCQLLLIAGFETTVNLIGNGVYWLGKHQDQWELLRDKQGLAASAVEEILRFDPPVPITARTAQTDVALAGRTIRKNSVVLTMIAIANRDPEVYADPDTFDITRDGPEHFAFSSGVHYCLGAQLARIEGEIALRVLSERLPKIRFAGTPRLRQSSSIRGFLELPVAA